MTTEEKTSERKIAEEIAKDKASPPRPEDVTQSHPAMRYSREVKIGDLECWIRLPNKFDQEEIRRKAMAARAREIKMYQDPESDLHTIVDAALIEFDELSDAQFVEHLTERHVREKAFEAMMTLDVDEKWENYEEDRNRFDYLTSIGDTDTDEYKVLAKIIAEYTTAVEIRLEELLHPIKLRYQSMSKEELVHKMRRAIIKAGADDAYQQTYNRWQMFLCTRQHDNHHRRFFKSYDDLMNADNDLINKLDAEFAIIDSISVAELKKSVSPTPSLLSHSLSEISETGE